MNILQTFFSIETPNIKKYNSTEQMYVSLLIKKVNKQWKKSSEKHWKKPDIEKLRLKNILLFAVTYFVHRNFSFS